MKRLRDSLRRLEVEIIEMYRLLNRRIEEKAEVKINTAAAA